MIDPALGSQLADLGGFARRGRRRSALSSVRGDRVAESRAADYPPPSDGGLTVGQRIGLLETTVLRHGDRLDVIEDWRSELKGAFSLVKFALGTSIISMILGLAAIVALFATGAGVK